MEGKGSRKVNMVQVLCKHVCIYKIDAFQNYYRNKGKGQIKESGGGRNPSRIYLTHC
jgi:hypothetical protein